MEPNTRSAANVTAMYELLKGPDTKMVPVRFDLIKSDRVARLLVFRESLIRSDPHLGSHDRGVGPDVGKLVGSPTFDAAGWRARILAGLRRWGRIAGFELRRRGCVVFEVLSAGVR